MMTHVLRVDPHSPEPEKISQAAEVIRSGGLVAFPTETVYGLGADALSTEAVRRIFEAKGRPLRDPIIVHISREEELELVAREVPLEAEGLIRRFWPGPLTLVLPKSERVPSLVTAGLPTVGVRMPVHRVARALIARAGPIAAPSANLFGRPSPTRAEHVLQDLEGRIELLLDGGPTTVGVESTVLDLTSSGPPRILRPGGVSREALEEVLGEVKLAAMTMTMTVADSEADEEEEEEGEEELRPLPSPGMMKRHYAPRARLFLFNGAEALPKMRELLDELVGKGERVGLLVPQEHLDRFDPLPAGAVLRNLGSLADLEGMAKALFASLREIDGEEVSSILVLAPPREGLGLAIFDRLYKAAGSRVIS